MTCTGVNGMTDEEQIRRADTVARQCAPAGVLENQLALVLAHLKRHHDVRATGRLLENLCASPFARRTKSTRLQFEALEKHLRPALASVSGWEEAAGIVGWAKRLSATYRKRTY